MYRWREGGQGRHSLHAQTDASLDSRSALPTTLLSRKDVGVLEKLNTPRSR
ncbi:hypothetical protein E2C01_093649 [Portunus trituberculatus]|uniref:Uncharacterized protein n=1 Tax=Portunus trituberculatus TaxID=210409 RepID=A0A5B7JVE0_PORTR|nr:hypothetical protein [Portunus trituberculatus]